MQHASFFCSLFSFLVKMPGEEKLKVKRLSTHRPVKVQITREYRRQSHTFSVN